MEQIIHGDCLEIMKGMADKSVDLVLTDPPYGTTACSWDKIVSFEEMWRELLRVGKEDCAYIFTASQPFTSALVMSNQKMFKYELIWEKSHPTGLFSVKYQPMKYHENILIFSKGKTKYNPQKWKGAKNHRTKNITQTSSHYGETLLTKDTLNGLKYPKSILTFNSVNRNGIQHPTQKPVALFEYIIKTYSNENDLILDPFAGSCTTLIACKQLNRRCICIEKEEDYVNICRERLSATSNSLFN